MKNSRIFLIAYYGLCSMISCSTKTATTLESTTSKSVTIIFKNAPPQSFTNKFGLHLGRTPELTVQYVDSTGFRAYYIPRSVGYDTITIPAYYGFAELSHRNQAIDEIYYLFKAGDTVLVTYGENLRPQLVSLSDTGNTTLYNLFCSDPRAVQPMGWSTHTILTYGYRLHRTVNLDSLATVYKSYINDFSTLLDTMELKHNIPQVYIDYYRWQLFIQASRKAGFHERLAEHLPYMTDSLMHYISYYRHAILYKGSMPVDERFDTIVADTLLQPLARKAILQFIMERIVSDDYGLHAYTPELKRVYGEKYAQLTGDTTFCYRVISAQNVLKDGYSNDLVLKSPDGQQYKYNDILTKHKGKVIYVDLWASWCGPCRAGMPEAKLLREEYKNKDVVFLYLAVNDTEAAWLNALKTLELDYLGENYMTLNARDAQFFKEIKQSRIPHFLLYDRSGKLVDMDAPRPHGSEIRNLLDKLLKE